MNLPIVEEYRRASMRAVAIGLAGLVIGIGSIVAGGWLLVLRGESAIESANAPSQLQRANTQIQQLEKSLTEQNASLKSHKARLSLTSDSLTSAAHRQSVRIVRVTRSVFLRHQKQIPGATYTLQGELNNLTDFLHELEESFEVDPVEVALGTAQNQSAGLLLQVSLLDKHE